MIEVRLAVGCSKGLIGKCSRPAKNKSVTALFKACLNAPYAPYRLTPFLRLEKGKCGLRVSAIYTRSSPGRLGKGCVRTATAMYGV